MTSSQRWSLFDGKLVRRHRAARAAIDHYLDRLVDIFDFPVARPSFNSVPEDYLTTKKRPAPTIEDVYTSAEADAVAWPSNKKHKVHRSLSERVRRLLIRSPTKATRKPVAICHDSAVHTKTSRSSWFPERSTSEMPDGMWMERDEDDRQLECGYQCLVENASI